jgi:hypothetical protein
MTYLERDPSPPTGTRSPCGPDTHAAGTCECRPFERLRFWNGRLLTARDLEDQQADLIRRIEEHQRHAHGYGVVCGLAVTRHPREECQDRYVVVEPGIAYDCCGHPLIVCERTIVEVPCPEPAGKRDAEEPPTRYASPQH